eukprot:5904500-Amphidinium_carterae.1
MQLWFGRVLRGMATLLVVDQGTEFQREFGEAASGHGSLVVTVNTRTPWEAGKTEKAGGCGKICSGWPLNKRDR